ncbi:MAG: 50S ribosomal protein L29 [Parcubacteria group bacterium GW2011_GWA2_42_11]|nr:MAG: 50S ribosomal protein L29 [Parcubacteria group bacterium GW2011_GWA2_42_11]KKT76507.1 MAG: 50S ribosomal protein L29 [Parcubacteria group bacterium GW2011_GWF2_44_7]
MTIKELKQKSQQEMELMLRENREKLRQFKFDLASKKLKKTNQIKETKRIVARILTIKNSK